jgi:hypothetical protein
MGKVLNRMAERSEFSPTLLRRGSPPQILQDAYKRLKEGAEDRDVITEVDLGQLMRIGLAANKLKQMTRCHFCPRLALPRSQFCREHSQAKHLPGTDAEKAARYRIGKAIAAQYNYYFPDVPKFVEFNELTAPQYMARLLWGKPLPDEERTIRAIKKQIALSSHLIELIGEDFGRLQGVQFYRRLQERVDPEEVRPRVWRWKMQRLKHWYAYEEVLAASLETPLPKYLRNLSLAAGLEKHGSRKSQIAQMLAISPSTISSWLKRSGTKSLREAYEYHLARMPRRAPFSPGNLHKD